MEIWGEAVGGKYGTVWRRLVGYLEVLAEEVRGLVSKEGGGENWMGR